MILKSKKSSQAIVLYVDGDQAFAYSYRKRGRGARLRAEGHSRLGQAINQIEPVRLADDLGGVFRQLSSTTKECILVLPSHLAPSVIVEVPDISIEDQKGFVQIQAEQHLPLSLSEIHLATHQFQIENQDYALNPKLKALNSKLKAQNAKLKAQNTELKSTSKSTTLLVVVALWLLWFSLCF